MVGPDLANVTQRRDEDWLRDFISSSSSMIEEGDSLAQTLFQKFNETRMPDQELSEGEMDALLSYISSESPDEKEKEVTAQKEGKGGDGEEASEPRIEGDAEKGLKFFAGRQIFKNGGPSCISCHHVKNDGIIVGGGRYAKDLTRAHHRLGSAGIKGMLESPGFPEMKEAYDDEPLTKEEVAHLTAFLKKAEEERLSQAGMDMSGGFLFWGAIIGVPLFLLLIALIWVRRRKKPVEHKIFQRKGYGAPVMKGKATSKA